MSSNTLRARSRGAAIAAATALVLLAGCSKSDGPDPKASQDSYKKAAASFDRGDLRSARIDLLSALKSDKNNKDARILFARVLLARGAGVQAQTEIERALASGYPRDRAQHLLAHAYLLQNNPVRALQLAEARNVPEEFQGYAARMRGRAQAGLNRPQEADREFQRAAELSPRDPAVWVDLARYRIAARDIPRAVAAIDQALIVSPNSSEALMLKGGIVRATQGLQGALPYYNRIVATDANNIEARLERAATFGDLNRPKDAKADLDHVLGLQPGHPLALYLQAMMEAKGGRFNEAQQILNNTKNTLENYLPAQMLQGFVALQLNNPAKAVEAFSKVVASQPQALGGRRLLAYAQLRSNNPTAAIATLEPFTKIEPQKLDPGMLALMGSAFAQGGRMKEAQNYLELSKKLSGNRAPVDTQLAMTKFAQGNVAGAEVDLQNALQSNPNSTQALTSLTLVRLNERKYQEALAASNRLIKASPKMPAAYNLRAAALLGMRDVKGAEANFRQALQIDPNYGEARRNLAQLFLATNRIDQGRQELEALTAKNSNDAASFGLLAAIAGSKGQTDQRLDYLRRAVIARPNAIEPRAALTQAYVQAGQTDRALTEAGALARTNGDNPGVVQLLAAVQLAAKQPAAAVQTMRAFADKNPESAPARAIYARALRAAGQPTQARAAYEEALKLPNAPAEAILVDLIQLEVGARNIPAALAAANRLKARQPILGDKAIGDIQFAAGNASEGIAAYQRIYAKQKNAQTLALVASAQARSGRMNDAMATVEAHRRANPRDAAAGAVLADLQIARGDWRGAVASYAALQNTPIGRNPVVLNNYAWALGQVKDKRAVPVAAQAYKLAPRQPAVMDTYGFLLVSTGANPKQGLQLLQQAAKGAPNDGGIRLHLAQAYRANGNPGEARKQLEMVAQRGGPQYAPLARQALATLR